MEGKFLVWREDMQHYVVIPGGEIASHVDIHDNFIPKVGVERLLDMIKVDVERNKRNKVEVSENEKYYTHSVTKITYDPEMIKLALENLL